MSPDRFRSSLSGAPFAIFLLNAFLLAAAATRLAEHAFGSFDRGVRISDVPMHAGLPHTLGLVLALIGALAVLYWRADFAWGYCAALAGLVGALALAAGEIPVFTPIIFVLSLRRSVRQGHPR